MHRIIPLIVVISYISFIGFFIISVAIYKINQHNINKIIELYIEAGLYMSAGARMGHFLGIDGQFYVAIFFYMLLTGRKIRINEPDSKYMYQKSYDFIQKLPKRTTNWLKIYMTTITISLLSFAIGIVFLTYDKYAWQFFN
ncbi:hypothetical protein ACSLVK_01835 [Photorhabdus tasmaniensis]|uniref:hypothetical protein n=1 Tax=Photorhabdus tasmaniensis TaxID=1004159 RepID=UPI004042B3A5